MNDLARTLRLVVAVTLVCVALLVRMASADDYPLLVTHEPDFGAFYIPQLAVISGGTNDPLALAPVADDPLNLGLPTRPWRNVYARNKVSAHSFVADDAPGINTVIHFGQCVLTIQGGIIVSAVVPPANQPCP